MNLKKERASCFLARSQNPDSRFPRRVFLKGVSIGAASMAAPFPLLAVAAESTSASAEPGLFEIIYSMRAMRRLKPDPIPEETLKKIVDAGIHAPSGGNRQDWGFILVRDPELKRFIRDRSTWRHSRNSRLGVHPCPSYHLSVDGLCVLRSTSPNTCTKRR